VCVETRTREKRSSILLLAITFAIRVPSDNWPFQSVACSLGCILGSPDDLKFRSCVTLFGLAASNEDDRSLFKQALDQFCEGKPDLDTEQSLGR
jgi:Protein of unknown function (DUF1810)